MRFPKELQCLAGVDETSAISAKEQSKKGEKDIPHKTIPEEETAAM